MLKLKNSLSAKVFLWVLCALTVCCLVLYGLVMFVLPKQYTTLTNSRTSERIGQLVSSLDSAKPETAKKQIYNFCIENHTYAMMHTEAGNFVFGDQASVSGKDNAFSFSNTITLAGEDEPVTLTVVSSASTEGEITHIFLRILPVVIVVILLISSVSAWLCSTTIVRPVLAISGVSKRMAQLDMTWHCDVKSDDELGVLAMSLNTLSQHLTQALSELEEANGQLKKDIEASHVIEKQRRDFFSAASHELKTPVTVLKGLLESMEMGIGDYKNHEKYLPQAISAVNNMESLISEILLIAKMETGIPAEAFTIESIADIMDECVAVIKPLAEKKCINVVCTHCEDITIRVYRPMFKKAVTNVLLNAVQYSPDDVTVSISWTHDTLIITNDGVIIPDEDIPSLFTPFYRAEKSRNRKSGGSGLGLYIVKTIFDLHGCNCRIENGDNQVSFTVDISSSAS